MRTGQRRRLLVAAALMTAAGATAATTGGAALAETTTPQRDADLQTAREATAKYQDVTVAMQDGFSATPHCDQDRKLGAMGYHYANSENFGSTDPARPAVLLYAPAEGGGVRLAGVEWVVPDRDQKRNTDEDRPSMFDGVDFQGPMKGHFKGMPVHYDLHVWLYDDNPSGMFTPYNPSFSCPSS